MKIYQKAFLGISAAVLCFVSYASASVTPTLTLTGTTGGVQVSVYADSDSIVGIYYTPPAPASGNTNLTIGTTDASGHLLTTLSPSLAGFTTGGTAYVIVNSLQSSAVSWPGGTTTTSTSSSSSSGSFYLSQTSLSLAQGASQTVTINGIGGYYISSNTNSNIASASISGNSIVVYGNTVGSANIDVCQSDGECATLSVSVGGSTGTTVSSTGSGIVFSQNNLVLPVGQSQAITLSGAGDYYIASNSSPSAVSAGMNGSVLSLYGSAAGSASVTVCSGSQCAVEYVSVGGASGSSAPQSVAPVISSFTVSSNDVNGTFVGAGDMLTFSWTTNVALANSALTVANTRIAANGTGNGPYTAAYTMTGGEPSPLPLAFSFTDLSGNASQTLLSLGNGTAVTIPPPVVTTTTTVNNAGGYDFETPLDVGATGADVTALQQRLTADGLFSGPITGYYGSLTEAAVEAYQTRHGLTPLGSVGPGTRSLLDQGI